MISALEGEARLVVDAQLKPVLGSTFQPTGFPDLGAATFQRPGDPPALLVESVQSLTNHFEAIGWDEAVSRPREPLADLPYVRVEHADDERYLTSSRTEPHRLAAAYVRDAEIDGGKGTDWITERLGLEPGRPLDWPSIFAAILQLDPLCLVHGVYFSDKAWHGQPKVRRALAAVIEAHDVTPAISGGLKRDDVSFRQGAEGQGRGAEEGYGFVPYGRTDYTAREIVLTASIDLAQIRGYGLGEPISRLLTLIAMWEVTRLLEQPLRLRTACDLEVVSVTARRPDGFSLPSAADLAGQIQATDVSFDEPGARIASWPAAKAK